MPPQQHKNVKLESEEQREPIIDLSNKISLLSCDPVDVDAGPIHDARSKMNNGRDGVWTGTEFVESGDPASKFPEITVKLAQHETLKQPDNDRRFVHIKPGADTMLIYTGGSCLNNHTTKRTRHSGYSFMFNSSQSGIKSSGIQESDDLLSVGTHTNNRAELHAVIAALESHTWWLEGWNRIVIAADSEYLCKGATDWLSNWANRCWLTTKGTPVANQDL
ncbi:ribonuclease H-like domain-containing protein [Hypomontagnella submonticulosa]|nr:ribonuclease H-like domain-containing protein [Hypomontagnella submonticulosa]